jgi:hypothetical protein
VHTNPFLHCIVEYPTLFDKEFLGTSPEFDGNYGIKVAEILVSFIGIGSAYWYGFCLKILNYLTIVATSLMERN